MKLRLVEFLICPCCKADRPLRLESFKTETLELTDADLQRCEAMSIKPETVSHVIVDGVLCCDECKTWYPIKNRTAIMHRFEHALHRSFAQEFGSKSSVFKELHPPQGAAWPGEKTTMRNYTKTWETIGEGELTFHFNHEQLQRYYRGLLDHPEWVLTRKNLSVLDVGVGFGYEAKNLRSVIDGEVFGVDLNLSQLQSSHIFDKDPFLHLFCCSLFEIPLRKKSFDVVVSIGVLHHTVSTKQAVHSIATHMKDDGMLLVWVYSTEDFGEDIPRVLLRLRELLVRPTLSRMPMWIQNPIMYGFALLQYPYDKQTVPNPHQWKLKNTLGHLRDRYTPVYAHRHLASHPYQWLDEIGMDGRDIDQMKFKNTVGFWHFGITVRGTKRV